MQCMCVCIDSSVRRIRYIYGTKCATSRKTVNINLFLVKSFPPEYVMYLSDFI